MRRIRTYLFMLIIGALAVHLVWIAIAPLIPYAVGGVAAVGVVGAFYYRRGRW